MSWDTGAAVRGWPRTGAPRESTLTEVWEARELLHTLTIRNLKVKYKRSVLGFVWTLLNPLITVAVLVTVFGAFVKIGIVDYWAFLVSGYFVWNLTAMTLTAATRALPEHAALARSVSIPGHVFVLAAVGSKMFEFLIEMALVLVALSLFHHGGIPIGYTALPVLIILQTLLLIGLALPIATLSAFFDDVQHMLPVLLLILFYLSPVFYPVEMVPESFREMYLLNPIAHILTAFHVALYDGVWPPTEAIATIALVAIPVCVLGFMLFNRYRKVLVEIV